MMPFMSAIHAASPDRHIGSVAITVARRDDALATMLDSIARRDGRIFGFANAHSINLARRDPVFAETLRSMTIFNDGIGVSIGSRMLYGADFPDNLNGTDLTPALLSALPADARVFLLGSAPGVADRAAEALAATYPQIVIAGAAHGYFGTGEETQIAQAIATSAPHLILVAMGQPRQERWALANAGLGDATILCVGAFLDFAAGEVPRAPRLVRSARMEWAYRLAIEPRRLAGRYLVGNATFLWAMLRQRITGQQQ